VNEQTASTQDSSRRSWLATLRSFGTLLAGEGAARVFGLLSIIILARQLGPHGFGPVVFGTSLLAWYWLVVDNGTQVASTPEIARNPAAFAPAVRPVLGLRIALSVTAAVVLVLGAQVFSNNEASAQLYSLFAITLPIVALNPRWLVLGVGESRLLAVANVVAQAVVLAGVVTLVHGPHDVNRVPFIVAASELLAAIVLLAGLARRFGLLWPRVELGAWWNTLRHGGPLMVGSASRGLLLSFDLLVIVYALGPGSAGYYGAATKPVLFAGTVAGLFSLSLLPSISAASASDAWHLYRRAARSAAAVSTAGALCLSVGAGVFVDIVYGDEFGPAAGVLTILALRIPFMAMSGVYTSVLIAGGQQVQLMRNNIGGAAVNVVGVLAAVKLFGIEGAATVSVCSAAVISFLNHRSSVRAGLVPPWRMPARRSLRPSRTRSGS
jgi:O-antigen/teichoic acid export membrane protein